MVEWFIASDLKSEKLKDFVGSNPTPPLFGFLLMIRIKSTGYKRRKKILRLSKGFRMSKLFKQSYQKQKKSLFNKFVSRKLKKRFFRCLWITKINSFLKRINLKYSIFIHSLKKQNIGLNRKMIYSLLLLDILSLSGLE